MELAMQATGNVKALDSSALETVAEGVIADAYRLASDMAEESYFTEEFDGLWHEYEIEPLQTEVDVVLPGGGKLTLSFYCVVKVRGRIYGEFYEEVGGYEYFGDYGVKVTDVRVDFMCGTFPGGEEIEIEGDYLVEEATGLNTYLEAKKVKGVFPDPR